MEEKTFKIKTGNMKEEIFTMSEGGKSEYCCNVIRVGDILPIEGADLIGQTYVNVSESIVVRKDQIRTGDILFYASNETELNEGFLSANNLFDFDNYDRNANAWEVSKTVDEMKELKERERRLKAAENSLNKLLKRKERTKDELDRLKITKRIVRLQTELSDILAKSDGKEFPEMLSEGISEYREAYENMRSGIKPHVGFFNKYGRVKMLRLKGVPSMGYLFTLDELIRWKPELAEAHIDMESLIGKDFDTVCGELLVKAYVPRVKEPSENPRSGRKEKKLDRFDRIIPGTFRFHYDTDPLGKNIWKIRPDNIVTITNKMHGTSAIFANVPVRSPKKLSVVKRIWNYLTPKKWNFIDYDVVNDLLCSSRKVIKNRSINPGINGGYYDHDIWTEYGEILKPYIPEGVTVYGEICGYVGENGKMIQKGYDYGCEEGESFIMPYRITSLLEDGSVHEWEVTEVNAWTEGLREVADELRDKVRPMNIMYRGTLSDLYPDIDVDSHWHEEVYKRLSTEPRFGMEGDEPECTNVVPREGFVLRIEGDKVAEAFKCKSIRFLRRESELMSSIAEGNGELDPEMEEAY